MASVLDSARPIQPMNLALASNLDKPSFDFFLADKKFNVSHSLHVSCSYAENNKFLNESEIS